MSLSLSQPPTVPLSQSELSSEILAIVNNRRITEHSAMIWNIPSTQTIYSVVAAFQEACGEIVGVGAMHDMREDPTLKCIRASFATPYSLQIALNLSGTLWGGSKLLIRKYKGPNHGKTNSNLLLAQNGFNLNGINNLPSNLNNMSIQDIQHQTSSQPLPNLGSNAGINRLVNNGAINAGRGSNKTVAQQIFQHLDMQQLAYLMLVQQHITQNNQFKEQQEREKVEKELAQKRRKQREKHNENVDDIDSTDDDDDDDDEEEEKESTKNEFDDEQTNKNLNRKTRQRRRKYYRDYDDYDEYEYGYDGADAYDDYDYDYERTRCRNGSGSGRRHRRSGRDRDRKRRKKSHSREKIENVKTEKKTETVEANAKKEKKEKKYEDDRRSRRDKRARRKYTSYTRSRSRSRSRY